MKNYLSVLKLGCVFAVLGLLLTACPTTKKQADTTPADTGETLNRVTDHALNMGNAFMQGRGGLTALNIPPGLFDAGMMLPVSAFSREPLTPLSLRVLADGELPRGTWQWIPDEYWGEWAQVSPEPPNGVVMQWTAEDPVNAANDDAELTVLWNATVVVRDDWGDTTEVPTSAAISLTVDGDTLAEIDFTVSYYTGTGCPEGIDEPTGLTLVGWIGDESGKVTVDISYAMTANRLTTAGEIVLSAESDAFAFKWDLVANGALTRGADCFIEDFVVTGGSIAFEAASTEDGEATSIVFSVTYSNVLYDDDGEFVSVRLMNGSLTIDEVTVVTFGGTLDESMDNVTLSFANGVSMSLKEFFETAYDWDDTIGLAMIQTALHVLRE